MTLRPPKSWKDVKDFLSEAGFLWLFHKTDRGQRSFSDPSFISNVSDTIRSNPEHTEWLQKWQKIALLSDVSQDDFLSIFFDIARHIHSNNTLEAQKVLEQCRKGRVPLYSRFPREEHREDQSSTIPGANGIWDFIGVPSGLMNACGKRSDSPLSSIPDQDSGDISGDIDGREFERSDSPLSSPPDQDSGDISGDMHGREFAKDREVFSSVPSGIFSSHGKSLDRTLSSVLGLDVDDHRSAEATKVPDSCPSPTTESEHNGTIITTRRSKRLRTLQEQKSLSGHAAKGKRASRREKGLDHGAPIRRSQRQASIMRRQNDIETRTSGQSDGQRSCHDEPHLSTPRDMRAFNRAGRISSLDQSKPRNTNLKSSVLQAKKEVRQADLDIIGQSRATSENFKAQLLTIRIPPRSAKFPEDKNEPRTCQIDKGAGIDADPAKSCSKKRVHSKAVDETLTLENGTQVPEGDPPHKRSRLNQVRLVETAYISSKCVEPAADSPVSSSPSLASTLRIPRHESTSHQAVSTASSTGLHFDTHLPRTPSLGRANSASRRSSSRSSDKRMELTKMTSPLTPTTAPRYITLNDTPESSQSTLVGFSLTPKHPVVHYEPPWRQSIDPPSSPNSTRGPGENDTHSWHSPQPEASLCFPQHCSRMDVVMQGKKPPLGTTPPVWAQSRQELCESLPYFRSYQGGVYSRGKKALGYLLDGHPAAQDIWHAEGKSIISHAGGNSAVDKDTKQTMLVNDQTKSSTSCAALINSYKCGQPIVLIAGNDYNLFPYDLAHRSYVVLGYYLITQAWQEPEPSSVSPRGYFIRWKFLFQWIDVQGQPWWIQNMMSNETSHSSSPYPPLIIDFPPMETKSCSTCQGSSPQIYAFGWVCTYPSCPLFFRREDGGSKDQKGYWPPFLMPRAETAKRDPTRLQIRPGLPVNLEQHGNRETTTRRFWSGFWCENCGKLSCREYWTHWECSNCNNKFQVKHRLRSAGDGTLAVGQIKFEIGENTGIKSCTNLVNIGPFSFKCRKFKLPWKRGMIYLIEGNPASNVSADKIFLQYQRDAEDPAFFRRYSMKTHKLKGRMLSHYFSQNSGETYKYVGGTDNTVPLDKYSSVSQAISLIRERASAVLGEDPLFNEILSAAYMVDQKMEFHSDGEKDLGPIVASLSLGAPATMRFRAIPTRIKQGTPNTNNRKTPSIALTLTLRHGDVLIMSGAEIQEFYQHAVHPSGFRIAATARYIKP